MSDAALFGGPGPRWFSIPAHRPFVEDLARGLYDALAPLGPQALAEAVVLTPNRRAARALADAFLQASGGRALLAPQIRPLGDLEEGEPPFEPGDLALDLPPAIDPLRRRFELIGVAAATSARFGRGLDAPAALELADALGGFLDGVQIEEVDPRGRLGELVDLELAEHWQVSRDLLNAALEAWRARLDALGVVDVNMRRATLLRRLAEQWEADPPPGVLVAAGSTGTAPAAAALLAVVAAAPRGCVVLPGLDADLAEEAWAQVADGHPQATLKALLGRAGLDRAAVTPWPASAAPQAAGRWRRRVVNEAMRPADATADWRDVIAALRAESTTADPVVEGLQGLSVVAARDEEEAACVAALMLRETLETPDLTAALITPDQGLIRRVVAHLARWQVVPDSSAGMALAACEAGRLAHALARLAVDPLAAPLLLSLLKSPLARLGLAAEVFAQGVVELERQGLRGPQARDWPALERRLAKTPERAVAAGVVLARLRAILADLATPYVAGEAAPADAARALVGVLQALCADQDGDTGELWAGPGGAALGGLLAGLVEDGGGLPHATPAAFAELFERLLETETVRAAEASHPRLRILGAIEARMVRADRLILGGLEEGVWPRAAPVDPFLSRPMRQRLGLPSPERRLSLSAHDFAQAACAPSVTLLHAERRDGAPAVQSRWLWRLQTLAKGAGVELPGRPELLAWARGLDAPLADPPASLRTAPRPRPTPPLEARPRQLPVTGVERWVRDPYAVYARQILKLYPLERPGGPVDVRIRGTAIHAALERFATEHPRLGSESAAAFTRLLLDELTLAGAPPASLVREGALAANAAPWVVAFEQRRRQGARVLVEQEGALTLDLPGGPFRLTAKADRLEHRGGGVDILDFKTGQPPSKKQMQAGLSPQLTLTAAIVQAGGFRDAGRVAAGELVYVRVGGGRIPGDELIHASAADSHALGQAALEGLIRRIERFDDPSEPYVSWAAPQFIHQFEGDYDHLARLWEWHVIGEGDAGESAA